MSHSMTLRVAFVSLLALGLGCAADTGAEPGSTASEIVGGCHVDCPRCPPNQVCPLIACREVCNAHTACVQNALCILGYHWSSSRCGCVPDNGPSQCRTDADCRTFADYCTGCDCRALSTRDADPTCAGPGVRCLADPCAGVTAVCLGGSCSLR